jgi:DNA-binding NarL/FixJ family response regulator
MPITVLIVDDSLLARMSLARAMNAVRPEWIRIEASDVSDALAKASHSPVDIALLDFNMPGRDGLDLAADLKKNYPKMRMAIISANIQKQILDKAASLDATFLEKPLDQRALSQFFDEAELAINGANN